MWSSQKSLWFWYYLLSSLYVPQVAFLYYLLWCMYKAWIFKTSIFGKWIFYLSTFVFFVGKLWNMVENLKISVGCKSQLCQRNLLEMKSKCALSLPVTFTLVVKIWLTDLKELFLPLVITLACWNLTCNFPTILCRPANNLFFWRKLFFSPRKCLNGPVQVDNQTGI